jgi:hypothetical protein
MFWVLSVRGYGATEGTAAGCRNENYRKDVALTGLHQVLCLRILPVLLRLRSPKHLPMTHEPGSAAVIPTRHEPERFWPGSSLEDDRDTEYAIPEVVGPSPRLPRWQQCRQPRFACGRPPFPWLATTLRQFRYGRLTRADKGVLWALCGKVTGYSLAQLNRLIAQWQQGRQIVDRRGPPAQPFVCRYAPADVARLVELDRLHGQLSVPATKMLAERAWNVFGDAAFQTLSGISVAHLYNLRASAGYQRQRGHHQPTRSRSMAISERRRPQPDGQPGYLRVDSVHQGDWEGIKGLFVINMVDAVTHVRARHRRRAYQRTLPHPGAAAGTRRIPVRDSLLPFRQRLGVHQPQLAQMLDKLRIEFTKSRARRTNDNALVESKNASVVRKHLGYSHIPSHHAQRVNAFLRDFLTPYLSYHRPCFFPEITVDDKGRQRRRYPYKHMNTPYERLKANPAAQKALKPDMDFEHLDAIARALTDNQAAEQLNREREKLFSHINDKKAA